MGCGDVRLLRTIGSVDFTGQERAALNRLTMPRALLTGQAAKEYDPGRVPCFAIVLSVRDRSLCLRASEAEAQAAGRLDAADVNGHGAPI